MSPRYAAAALLVIVLACLGLAACGGSSKSSANSSSTTSTSSSGAGTNRFAAVRACLQKNGITLPQRALGQKRTGQRPPNGGGGFLGGGGAPRAGGPKLPAGVSQAQYEAALKKCGAGNFGAGGANRFKSPAFRQSLTKFVTCMGQNGVKLPSPNTSGKGPVFNTKGLDTSSARFKAAESKCQSDLRGSFGHGRGGSAGGGAAAGGAPGAGGEGAPPAGAQ